LAHPVAQGRLCVRGWHAHELATSHIRLLSPLVRKNGQLVAVKYPEAIEFAAAGLREAKKQRGSQALAVLGSPNATNEANFALMRFARQVLGTNNLDFSGRLDWLPSATVNPSTPIENIDKADLIFLFDTDSGDDHPAVTARLIRARRRGAKLINIGTRQHRLARIAGLNIQILPGTLPEFIAGLIAALLTMTPSIGYLEGITKPQADYTPEKAARACGAKVEEIRQAAKAFQEAHRPLALLGRGAIRDAQATVMLSAAGTLFALGQALGQEPFGAKPGNSLMPLGSRGNSRGAREMGLDPTLLSGYQPITDEAARKRFESAWGAALPQEKGLNLWDMAGKVRALYVMADAPASCLSDPKKIDELLAGVEFLVVQDSINSALAERADVVLPGAALGEEEGTFTNLEGRVQLLRKALPPPAQVHANWEIVNQIARALGVDFGYESSAGIMQQIAALTPLYGSITYEKLEKGFGELLPAELLPSVAPAVSWQELDNEAAKSDADYPLLLAVDYAASYWEGDKVVLSCPTLRNEFTIQIKDFPQGFVALNPEDARNLNVRPMSKIKIIGKNGEFIISAQISKEVPAGVVLLPFWERAKATPVLQAMRNNADGLPCIEVEQVRIEGA
jgi:predicted molibdopterin-dependent oxidoreductase YjgC